MQINTQVYGAKADWIDAYAYPAGYDNNKKLQYANFGNNRSDIEQAYISDKLPLNEPWDKSPSYAALGDTMPLSNIEYWYQDGESEDPLKLKVYNRDQRQVTNYALGTSVGLSAVGNTPTIFIKGTEYYASLSEYNRYTNEAHYHSSYSEWAYFSPFTQIPLKRCVLVPFIEAYKNDWSAVQQFDLTDYINQRKTEYNKITRVFISMVVDTDLSYDPDTAAGTPSRSLINYQLCGGVVLDPLSYGNGYEYNSISLDNITKPIISNAVAGALFNTGLPDNMTANVWCVPVASGFDLDFTKISRLNQSGEITNGSRFYCDADELTTTQIRESVRHITAGFGLFFTDNLSDAQTKKLDDPGMMLGILDNGIGYGDYSSGSENRDQIQWDLDDAHDIDYDPDNPPDTDPNVYDTPSILNTPSNCSSGTRYYVLNDAAITNLVGELWKAQESKPSDTSYIDYNNEQYLSNNPVDMIVSCKRFPVSPAKSSSPEALVLGQYETNVQGYTLSSTTSWIDLGSKLVYRHFHNYLDYDTKLVLYIPFCGCIDLDTSVWMGETINVYMAIDYITGSVTAYLIRDRDKVIYATAEGNCSVDLPITGLQAATIEAQMLNAKSSLDSSKIMLGAKIVGGAAALAIAVGSSGTAAPAAPAVVGGITTLASTIADGYKINKQTYDLHHIDASPQQIGSTSPLNAWSGELTCRLYVYYPKIDPDYNAEAYSHSIGNATVSQGTVGSFGSAGQYASFTNADLSAVPCTDTEKTMIINALTSGVYL